MSDVSNATQADVPIAPTAPVVEGPTNARDAGNAIAEWRAKQAQPEPDKPVRDKDPSTGRFVPKAPESPLEGADAGPDEPVPGETEQDDQAELPPIDPPRSWSKEDKALFADLPRETQERLSERERSRESDFLKRQNEATEKSKALTAKEQAAEQARQQYETAAQNALQILQSQMSSEFADIKSHDDLMKLAETDPFRAIKFQTFRDRLQAQAQEVENLNRRRVEDEHKAFDTWSKEQDAEFIKQFPDFADSEKAAPLQKGVVNYLKEVGVTEEQLGGLWKERLFRDAKFQRVVFDASRFHISQQKAKAAVAVPKPAPQRPGTAAQKGEQFQGAIDEAQKRLNGAKGIEAVNAGAAMIAAKRAARR